VPILYPTLAQESNIVMVFHYLVRVHRNHSYAMINFEFILIKTSRKRYIKG